MEHVRDGCRCRCGEPDRAAVRGSLDSDRCYREVCGAPQPASQSLTLFVTVLFIAILLSIPGQSYWVLGVELVALAVIIGAGLLSLGRRASADATQGDTGAHALAPIIDAMAPDAITSILIVVAGLLLVFGVHAGLDVLVAPVVVALAGGVASAWLLLTKLPE
jgi:hypothetical protein